jgi:hypothetical protein
MSLSSIPSPLHQRVGSGGLAYAAGVDQVRARVDDHNYILLIRRYRVTSGTTLPATMAPSPTAAATSNRIFICSVSLLSPSLG